MVKRRVLPVYIFLLGIFALGAQSAYSADDNILSVDYTIFIQLALFLISLYILNKLIFKPFMSLMDQRDKLTRGALEEARDLEAKVAEITKDYDTKLAEARAQALEERNKIVHEGQQVADGIVSRSREETNALLHQAKEKLEADTEEIKNKVKSDVDSIGQDIASRVLGKEVSQ